jgi:Initiator Replication protein
MIKTSSTEGPPKRGRLKAKPRTDESSIVLNERRGILDSFAKLPRTERELIERLLEKFDTEGVGVIRFPIPYSREKTKERRAFLLPIYRLIRYHRLTFDTVVDGAFHSTYIPWIESITMIKCGGQEEIELCLNGNYEEIWRTLKESLGNSRVRLKSQYSSRLYQWAKRNVKIGRRRVSLKTLRKILGLEDICDEFGNVVQEAPLENWANVKQRALDQAINEINANSDIELNVVFTGRGNFRKVNSLGFHIKAKKDFQVQGEEPKTSQAD